mmetsp:Transcript_8184/g.11252  ORF Transcript_8184/g.11252 Transcript_8184/m.11252 type:complete len:224 (+) Transcript_8184:662-1333(+)
MSGVSPSSPPDSHMTFCLISASPSVVSILQPSPPTKLKSRDGSTVDANSRLAVLHASRVANDPATTAPQAPMAVRMIRAKEKLLWTLHRNLTHPRARNSSHRNARRLVTDAIMAHMAPQSNVISGFPKGSEVIVSRFSSSCKFSRHVTLHTAKLPPVSKNTTSVMTLLFAAFSGESSSSSRAIIALSAMRERINAMSRNPIDVSPPTVHTSHVVCSKESSHAD